MKKLLSSIFILISLAAQSQFIIPSQSTVNGFGDSYMKGVDGTTSIDKSFMKILENRLGCTMNNLSEGGAGVNYMLKKAWTTGTHVSAINNTNASIVQCGFNDAIRQGDNPKLLKKIYGAYVAFFANQFLGTAKPMSDATITKTGTWSNIGSTPNYPLKAFLSFGQTGRSSSTIGDKITFSVTGSTVVVGYITADGASVGNHGSFSVKLDGVLIDTVYTNDGTLAVSDPHYSNAYSPSAYVNHNLGNGSHTIELTLLENKPTLFDYIGTLLPPSDCAPMWVASIPKIDSTGYAGRPNNPSDATFDACTVEIWKAAKFFPGFPIIQVSLDSFISESDLAIDHVHLNDNGHSGEANAFMSTMYGVFPRWYRITQYTDATGKTKMFCGINARYNADGTFTQSGDNEVIGTIYNNTSTSTTAAYGELRDAAGATFSPKYISQYDNEGRNELPWKGTKTASGTGSDLSIVVTHTAPITPDNIEIIPTSAAMKDWYLSSTTSTTFTIVVPASTVGTNNISFKWRVEL